MSAASAPSPYAELGLSHGIDLTPGQAFDMRSMPPTGGVYVLADATRRPILLSMGENLRRVVGHRLRQRPEAEPTKRADLAQVARHVFYRLTHNRFETAWAHWLAARRLFSGVYRKQLGFGPAWMLRLEVDAAAPRWRVVKRYEGAGRYAGPFARRSDAEALLQILEDAFDLCRYYDILQQAPRGEACAYYEMGKCPAPCDGTISMDAYRAILNESWAFARGRRGPRLAALEADMRSAADALAFERAAAIRQTLDRAAGAAIQPAFRHVTELSTGGWIIILPSGPRRRDPVRRRLSSFILRGGRLKHGPAGTAAELDVLCARWCALFDPASEDALDSAMPADDDAARSEALWLAAKFVFQDERGPGVFVPFDEPLRASDLGERVCARFDLPSQRQANGGRHRAD